MSHSVAEDWHTPILGDALQHNQRILSDFLSLSSLILGCVAGALGLESYTGFGFYIFGSVLVAALVIGGLAKGQTRLFVVSGGSIFGSVLEEVVGGAMGYVLAWTLIYGLVKA